MKKLIVILTICVFGVMLAGNAMAGRVKNRQINQQKRIHQGVRSGELTYRETRVLQREQRQVNRHKRRVHADGVVTPRERVSLEAHQDKASYHIYRLKHNDVAP